MLSLKTKFFGTELADSAEALLPDASVALKSLMEKTCAGSEFTGWFNWQDKRLF